MPSHTGWLELSFENENAAALPSPSTELGGGGLCPPIGCSKSALCTEILSGPKKAETLDAAK